MVRLIKCNIVSIPVAEQESRPITKRASAWDHLFQAATIAMDREPRPGPKPGRQLPRYMERLFLAIIMFLFSFLALFCP